MPLTLKIPKGLKPWLRIGTSSWKYRSWKGLVYDPKKSYAPPDYLPDYAKVLDSVEIDQWFYSLFARGVRLPDPSDVRLYEKSVPPEFVFTVKAPNAITLTHYYTLPATPSPTGLENPHFLDPRLLKQFLRRLAPFGPKLGPVMFQFEYMNRKKMPSFEVFLDRFDTFIRKAPKGFQYAVETRNPDYLRPPFFDFLKTHGLGFVCLEGYYMPPIAKVFADFAPETAPFQVVRLHGRGQAAMQNEASEIWNKIVTPRLKSLKTVADIVRANARKKVLTYVNVSNHFEGSAPLTVGRLLEVLKKKPA